MPGVFQRSTIAGLAFLTVLAVGAYFMLRALPDAQCGFLHFEEVVNENGEVEFCATNHAGFLDLTRLSYPVRAKVEVVGSLAAGETAECVLELTTPGGVPIAPHQLAITHTKKLHLMVVDSSLQDYHHLHPEPEDTLSGRYRFAFTPLHGGTYRFFAEFVPVRTRRQVIATGAIEVAGEPVAARFEPALEAGVAGLQFRLGGELSVPAGVDRYFGLEVAEQGGETATLETIMGAKGHMVAFDYAGRGFAHMHPISSIDPDAGADDLDFLLNLPEPGRYRLWAQVMHGGREVFAPFDLEVQ